MQHVSLTEFCFSSGKNAITDNHLCEPPDLPGCGLAQGAFLISLHETNRQLLYTFPWTGVSGAWNDVQSFNTVSGSEMEPRWKLMVTFFIKGINSPSNNLNAFKLTTSSSGLGIQILLQEETWKFHTDTVRYYICFRPNEMSITWNMHCVTEYHSPISCMAKVPRSVS